MPCGAKRLINHVWPAMARTESRRKIAALWRSRNEKPKNEICRTLSAGPAHEQIRSLVIGTATPDQHKVNLAVRLGVRDVKGLFVMLEFHVIEICRSPVHVFCDVNIFPRFGAGIPRRYQRAKLEVAIWIRPHPGPRG